LKIIQTKNKNSSVLIPFVEQHKDLILDLSPDLKIIGTVMMTWTAIPIQILTPMMRITLKNLIKKEKAIQHQVQQAA
jgi:hypothetical protein